MNLCRLASSFVLGVFLLSGSSVHANTLAAAATVTLEGVSVISEGMVVVADEETQTYTLSAAPDDAQVYGVTAAQPPVVFATGENETPVVTEGIVFVQVSAEAGAIQRGDLLVSSSRPGVAMRAGDERQHVFAIALEAYAEDADGLIQAEVGAARAQLLRAQKQELAAAALEESTEDAQEQPLSFIRGAVAVTLVVGALGFLLYSFRSLLTHGVVSVGRNPRARGSIMTFSVANILFALLLCAVVVFIAVAILVLPL